MNVSARPGTSLLLQSGPGATRWRPELQRDGQVCRPSTGSEARQLRRGPSPRGRPACSAPPGSIDRPPADVAAPPAALLLPGAAVARRPVARLLQRPSHAPASLPASRSSIRSSKAAMRRAARRRQPGSQPEATEGAPPRGCTGATP